jgi:transposase
MDIDLSALPGDVQTLQRMVRTLVADRTALSQAQAELPNRTIAVLQSRGSGDDVK